MNRRHFLGLALSAATMPALAGRSGYQQPRVLSMHHAHTKESIRVVYRTGNFYQRDELQKLNHFLRDFRTGEVVNLDVRLFDLLYDIKRHLGYASEPIQILSAYRSSRTNAMLRKTSRWVARNSLHVQGKALDIRFPGVSTRQLRNSAVALNRGGVGFYPSDNFVHVDTGSIRHWTS